MKKRTKKKETKLFFDSFKHFKNNFCNLICMELPTLVDMNDVDKYLNLKSVNYKSKYPDMKKIGLIDYDKPSDKEFTLSEEGKIIYDIIKTKKDSFEYNIKSNKSRLESIKPAKLWKKLNDKEQKTIETELIKLLISYYDTADSIRPYLSLIKVIEKNNIKTLDTDTLCNILAQTKTDILLKKINKNAFSNLDKQTQIELKRPISYMINGLETAGIINEKREISYDKELVKDIVMDLNEIYIEAEEGKSKRSSRSAKEQNRFREEVLKAYDYKCAITGEDIQIKNKNNKITYLLEAAHIIPYSDSGSFSVNNGIALCVEMHRLFDKKLFTFQYREDGNVEVIVTESKRVTDKTGLLKSINHKIISLPKNEDQWPDPSALEYRKKEYLL